MEPLSVLGNLPGQSYGSDAGGALAVGQVIKATVVQQLDDELYLLSVGKLNIEAKVAADLQEGVEYQMVVEKLGNPPQLNVVGVEQADVRDAQGLTAAENKFIDKLSSFLKNSGDEVSKVDLLAFVKSMGFSADDNPEMVYEKLKKALALVQKVDQAMPAIRQTLAQTLLFTMQSSGQLDAQNALGNQTMLENTIKLSGEVPRWSEAETFALHKVKDFLNQLPPAEKKYYQSLFLGLNQDKKSLDKLEGYLNEMIKKVEDPSKFYGKVKPDNLDAARQQLTQKILSDVNSRFFLGSSEVKHAASGIGTNLDRHTAIQSFQNQAPGLTEKSISSMLEQFVSLGGKLEKLSLGDVLSAKLAWKGEPPSAINVHRTGALLYLSQEQPSDSRMYGNSPVLGKAKPGQLPVILDRGVVNDPSGSSVSMNNLKEFSQSSKLPNSYHITRLLQFWTHSGGTLAELRPQIDSIQAWSQFIESYPAFRSQLVDYLMKDPIFSQKFSMAFEGGPATGNKVNVLPETRAAFTEAIEQNGQKVDQIPGKALRQALEAVQTVAGENQQAGKSLVTIAAWMLSRNMEVTAKALASLNQFQNGHSKAADLMQNLQQLKSMMSSLPNDVKDVMSKAWLELDTSKGQIKDVLSMYQKGGGKKLQLALESLKANMMHLQSRDATHTLTLVSQLIGQLKSQEEYLMGLKQYNIQAQRNDTPQVYEIPVSFGEDMEKAFIKVFKRNQGSGKDDEKNQYKVVIDLNLEGLGNIRTELAMYNKHMQLDFLSPEQMSLNELKEGSIELSDRLDALNLNTSMSFKNKKNVGKELLIPAQESVAAKTQKSAIDLSA